MESVEGVKEGGRVASGREGGREAGGLHPSSGPWLS